MIKLPNKIKIAGFDFKVIKTKKGGGSFDLDKCEIYVGTTSKENIANIFVHEVIEALFVIRGHRYVYFNSSTNDKMIFLMNHADFSNICDDLTTILKSLN